MFFVSSISKKLDPNDLRSNIVMRSATITFQYYLYDSIRKHALNLVPDLNEFPEADHSFGPALRVSYNASAIPGMWFLKMRHFEYEPKINNFPLFLNSKGSKTAENFILLMTRS